METKGTFIHYTGPLSNVPSTFFSIYIAGVDALDRSSAPARKLQNILSPSATFPNNGGELMALSKIEMLFRQRQAMLDEFQHGDPFACWDLENEGGPRTIIVKCTSR